ncbi:hypothetical protein [Rhodoblastus sp.]|uniref:hypothetical protein n=1 Tax=Rhodoblastus sp. TaxID=1962975 RepID=UPI0035AE7E45
MTTIDEKWFFERGHLHDACVTSARLDAGNVEIQFDDQWANERGLSKPEGEECPLTLRFISATVLGGNLNEAVGGWISELRPAAEGKYSFVFTNRDVLLIQAGSVQADCER